MSEFKKHVYARCREFIDQRIHVIKVAMDTAQASANDETKSSAGDKYETGRAMMQLELEKNSIQLAEANKLKQVLDTLDPNRQAETVQLGSLVTTNQGIFYLAVSAGKLEVDGKAVFAVSSASPIGAKLIGLKKGDHLEQNGKHYSIEGIE